MPTQLSNSFSMQKERVFNTKLFCGGGANFRLQIYEDQSTCEFWIKKIACKVGINSINNGSPNWLLMQYRAEPY